MKELIKKLDDIFSEWVRRSHANSHGLCKCVTCFNFHHWKEMDCGHYLSRENMSTRWDEKNVAPQCFHCNRLEDGRPDEFRDYLVLKYGEDEVLELEARSRSTLKYFRWELEAKIEYYKALCKELMNEKK